MFFNLISRNSRRSRKENGLFFGSLLISIIAFYIILSLSGQDVMRFLARMESDAVNRLLSMIPAFYGMTLFILFFLIYYASKFQLERRRHEFGVYLMLGMRRGKLFLLLLAEDFHSSIAALLVGLPLAVLLSELISLVTARLVGLGIIGHQFTFSPTAALLTAGGFLLIKFVAFLILSSRISRQEIGSLLTEMPEGVKRQRPACFYALAVLAGLLLLGTAYAMAISGLSWSDLARMGLTLLLGLAGTLALFWGLRFPVTLAVRAAKNDRQLHVFNLRQIQETVVRRSGTLAVCSLLILAALCCFGAGVAISRFYGNSEQHVLDYTFQAEEGIEIVSASPEEDAGAMDISPAEDVTGVADVSPEDNAGTADISPVKDDAGATTISPRGDGTGAVAVRRILAEHQLEDRFSHLFEMRTGYIRTAEDYDHAFRMDSVFSALETAPASEERDTLLNNLGYATYPHLIALGGYNQLLDAAGLPPLQLADDEAAVYIDRSFTSSGQLALLNDILASRPEVRLDKDSRFLTGKVQTVDLVTDSSITLSFALILPDAAFEAYTEGHWDVYLNGVLAKTETEQASLMSAISEMNQALDQTGLSYESYLQNMGRQLFYMVASSYITLYLAIIFLIIANTVIGVQFLISQQKSSRRYRTLIRLGAAYPTLCHSARAQVNWYFGIPIAVAACSSLFGIRALLTGILSARAKSSLSEMMVLSVAMILALCVIESIYITMVKRSSDRYLLTLMVPEREE